MFFLVSLHSIEISDYNSTKFNSGFVHIEVLLANSVFRYN